MGNFAAIGSRVSEDREGAELGSLNGSSEDKSQANDVKMESVNDSGPIEDCVMSEASSLLNTKQGSRDGFEEEDEVDDDDDEENGFHVGDFVWVQGVNRHQWWPGKIYDSSDASNLALKQMRKGTLLVAYCWNQTFAWCNPSQLKPFLENFREFSKTSGSISFRRAVEEAVREIGEYVEHMLVCDGPLVSPVAVNCGIKEGVHVPHVRREIVTSLVLEKPGIVLQYVKSLAKTASFSDLLEIEVLRRKVSAFYRSKGRFYLAECDEDRYIIGLEDREDDYALNFVSSSWQRSLRKCSGLASKKMKSIDEVSKVDRADTATSTGSNTLKRRVSDLKQVEEISNGKRKESGIGKREESNDSNHLEENGKKDDSSIELTVDFSTPFASVCKRAKVDVSSDVERNNGSGETIVQTGKRERKKSKYLSPEYMTDFSWSGRKGKIDSEASQIRAAERISKDFAEKALNFVELGATPEEILDLIRAAALSTQYSEDYQSSYDMIRGFASIYRSFTYDHESNYKINNKNVTDEDKQPDVKQQVVDEKEQTTTMVKKKNKREEAEKQFTGVDLCIKSGFGCTLPSKDDLMRTYSKFGALVEERSCMFNNNSCARVSFLNECDGEDAFEKSLEKCPFATTSTVTFELKYPSSETPENPNEKEADNRKGVMEIECLKKKLEEIRALLDQSEGGEITEELKMKLEEESRNLVDKVRKMSVRSG